MKLFLFILLIFSSSELLAKKIVLDCVGNSTLLIQKEQWDNSTKGIKRKVIIDTSRKTIDLNSMLFNEDFNKGIKIITAKTEVMNDMWYHLGIEKNGTMTRLFWLEETPLMLTTFDCKKNSSLW